MKIAWLGTASLLVECEEGSLLIDPYLKALSEGVHSIDKTMRESLFDRK